MQFTDSISSSALRMVPAGALVALCLVQPLPAQELPAPNLQADLPSSAYLDWGVGISGDRVITVSDITRAEGDPSQEWGRLLQQGAERSSVQTSILRELAMTRLEVNAGKVRGFDPLLVESLVDKHFERQVERFGGATEFTKRLQSWGMSPSRFRTEVTADLYRYAWRDSSIGKQPGPTGRVSVDRYIRPGYLLSTYKAFAESQDPQKMALVGGSVEEVLLQRIILPLEVHAPGLEPEQGMEKVSFLAEQLRTQILEGEATFANQAGAWDANRGQGEPIQRTLGEIQAMSQTFHQSELLFEFVQGAKQGDVSPPLPYDPSDGARAVLLYSLEKQLPAQAPKPFSDRTVQESLREHLLEEMDKRRITRARLYLVQQSHLHPEDLRPFLVNQEIRGR